MLSKLRHKNIVLFMAAMTLPPNLCIVMGAPVRSLRACCSAPPLLALGCIACCYRYCAFPLSLLAGCCFFARCWTFSLWAQQAEAVCRCGGCAAHRLQSLLQTARSTM